MQAYKQAGADSVQQEAICHAEGPMLLIAGPGSGKTRVITNRIRTLIQQQKAEPQRILTITFTKAAAMEMKARSIALCPQAAQVAFGTFHSVFYHILRQSSRYRDFTLLEQTEKEKLLRNILFLFGIPKEKQAVVMEDAGRLLSLCKNAGISYETLLSEEADRLWRRAQVEADQEQKTQLYEIMQAYQRECVLRRKIDFDDMLLYCKELLAADTACREAWQRRFSYIQVDEFQDINQVQYDVLRLLAHPGHNLFVVGDDDQAIYGFRGSDPSFMRRFQEDFAGCRRVYLSRNYRSCSQIVAASVQCIGHNQERFAKDITAVSSREGTFSIEEFACQEAEDAWLTDMCRRALADSHRNSSLKDAKAWREPAAAILLRTNHEIAYYAGVLDRAGIPWTGIRGRTGKADAGLHRETVQDIIAALQFAAGKRERGLFFRFMNKPERGISRIAVTDPVSLEQMKGIYGQSGPMQQVLDKLERDLSFLGTLDAYGALHYFLSVMGYEEYVRESLMQRKAEYQNAMETIDYLKKRAREHDTLHSFLQEALQQDFTAAPKNGGAWQQEKKGVDTDASQGGMIGIMTYHAAKGLEFDTVFLPGVKEGSVPHGRMLPQKELEEERRMFYVAMTRARERLYISYSGEEQDAGSRSPFVRELQEVSARLSAH